MKMLIEEQGNNAE